MVVEQVKNYWEKSDDDLYSLLGAELLGEGLGLSPAGDDRYRRFGREWFSDKRRELQRKICHSDKARQLLGTTGSDRLVDAYAIYEILQNLSDDSPTVLAVLAILIARVGLGAFCENAPTPR